LITEKTLFILGAGAHVPYGFPDAKGLRNQIILQFPNRIANMSSGNLVVMSDIQQREKSKGIDFTLAFRDSNLNSIDLFISLHPELSATGKKAICISMIDNEIKHSGNIEYFDKDDWFRYLFNRAIGGIQSPAQSHNFLNNNFSFVTFNYDRLIEKYLAQSLRNSFNIDSSELYNFLNHFRVRHVYGKIASLPDEVEIIINGDPSILDYGTSINKLQLDNVYQNIKIMYDERVSEKDWTDIISSYKRIFFLGFGYADENMEVLNLPDCLQTGQKVFGTALNCSRNEIKNIKQKFYKTSWMTNADEDLKIEPVNCLALLRDYL
jgi:hypothetical protein